MRCPRCGSDFEATVEQCFTCGWDFSEDPADFKPRTSRLAILSLVLGILCVFTLYLPLIPVLIISILSLRHIRKSRGKLTGERLAMAGILIPFLSIPILIAAGYAVWSQDAGPVPNEFTEADFNQVRPENEETYAILCQLNGEDDSPDGAPAIGLDRKEVQLLEKIFDGVSEIENTELRLAYLRRHSESIQQLWEKAAKGRFVLEKLNTYSEIADFADVDIEIGEHTPYSYDLKRLFKINRLYSYVLLGNGNDIEACEQLVEFDTLIRKHVVFTRPIISKLVCYGCIAMNLTHANTIINYPDTSSEALLILQSHFKSLTTEQLSMRNCFIHEYLFFKNGIHEEIEIKPFPLYKPNSINRYYHGICQNWILIDKDEIPVEFSPISVWPWGKPAWPKVPLLEEDVLDKLYDSYSLYNPYGSIKMKVCMPAIGKLFEIKEKVFIYDDMLQWVLARRLGRDGSLAARAYGDEYVVDVEKGLVYSPGPDGEAFTKDDIKLRINPVVLGLTEQQAVQESTTEVTE